MQFKTFWKTTEAVQWDGTDEAADAIARLFGLEARVDGGVVWLVSPQDGEHVCMVAANQWVIRNMSGRPHAISEEQFGATYLPHDAPPVVEIPVQRDVLDHRVEGKGGGADDTRVVVLDEPGQGGACHWYQVRAGDRVLLDVRFQNGPIQEVGVNGVQQEHLQAIVIDRLRSFQKGLYANRYNAIAMTKTEEALMWLHRRTIDRIQRGVEGLNKQ